MTDDKKNLDAVAVALHPHWPEGARKTYIANQLPGMVKDLQERLKKAEAALGDRARPQHDDDCAVVQSFGAPATCDCADIGRDHRKRIRKLEEALECLMAHLPGCQVHEMSIAVTGLDVGQVCENHATHDTGYALPICDDHVAILPERVQESTRRREYPYAHALRRAKEALKKT